MTAPPRGPEPTLACTACATTLQPSDRFCPSCGASSPVCTKCGQAIVAGDRFCAGCGASVGAATDPAAPQLPDVWTAIQERLRAATARDYRVEREIGRGGMAAVYRAQDIRLNRPVAIKVMRPSLLDSPGLVERFVQEARTVAALKHQNIVAIYDFRNDGDLYYFVMSLIEGHSLEKVLADIEPLPVAVVQSVLGEAGAALAYAHRRGVVHRDIKPGNILLDAEGTAIVTDFGIAKLVEGQHQTQTGAMIGTLLYMSPEQCDGLPVTAAADQYSLGIMAYEMLTGTVPFTGSTMTVIRGHCIDPVPSLRERRPDCPPAVEAAVLRMLAKRPEERFPSMQAALEALEAYPLPEGDPYRRELGRLATGADGGGAARFDSLVPVDRPSGGGRRSSSAPKTLAPALIEILVPDIRLEPGDAAGLAATVRSADGSVLAEHTVSWATASPDILDIESQSGAVRAKQPGRATVTARCGTIEASALISVGDTTPRAIEISAERTSLVLGDQLRLSVFGISKHGSSLGVSARWESSHPGVLSVSAGGVVMARSVGEATITANAGALKQSLRMTVTPAAVAGLQVSVPPVRVATGERFQLTAIPLDRHDQPITGRPVAWSVADRSIASVDREGWVTARAPGATTISVRCEDIQTDVPVTVGAASIAAITLSKVPPRITVGQSFVITARVDDASGARVDRAPDWHSSDPSVATVDQGTVTAVAPGRCTITARLENVQQAAPLVVAELGAEGAAPPRGGGLSPVQRMLLGAAAVTVLSVVGWRLARRPDTPPPPPLPGPSDTIVSAPAPDTTPAVVMRVKVSRSTLTLVQKEAQFVQATPLDSAGNPIAGRTVEWASDRPAVATVSQQGEITALGPGSAKITASVDGQRTQLVVTVETGATGLPASIQIVEVPGTLEEGTSAPLVARALTSDGKRTLAQVEWTSGDPGVATIDRTTGQVRAIAAGEVTLTAAIPNTGVKPEERRLRVTRTSVARLIPEPAQLSLTVSDTARLRVTPSDARSQILSRAQNLVDLASADPSIALVDRSGLVRAVRAGKTRIRASVRGTQVAMEIPIEVKAAALPLPSPPDPPDTTKSAPEALVFQSLAAGLNRTCGIRDDRSLLCWGAGNPKPQTVGGAYTAIAIGDAHRCALKSDRTAVCWGSNDKGQLGTGEVGSTVNSPTRVAGSEQFTAIVVGARHTCGLSAAGSVFCWGDNAHGQLGDGSKTVRTEPTRVKSDLQFKSISAGRAHTCAMAVDGNAWCWGDSWAGAVGGGLKQDEPEPVKVRTPKGGAFTNVWAGDAHSCGLDASGHAFCWGDNSNGQLGDGTKSERLDPRPVKRDLRFRALALAKAHTCGLATDGLLYCWGANNYGQLGNGTTSASPQPVEAAPGEKFTSLATGAYHTCGTREEDRVTSCWGNNAGGQVGVPAKEPVLQPKPVEAGG